MLFKECGQTDISTTTDSEWSQQLILSLWLRWAKNICCGYSLEAPHNGASDEYHNIHFCGEIRNIATGFGWKKHLIWRYDIYTRFSRANKLNHIQYGSGKRTNFFFHFADQFYNPRFSAEWFGVNHSEWKKFTRSYALDIPRTFSGPQCTHDIRSVCEYLRVATDYSVQVSLTTQIILSHDDNQTKIVTTAIIILTLVY